MKKCFLLAGALALTGYGLAQPSLGKLSETIKKQRNENRYQLKLTGPFQGSLQVSSAARLLKTEAQAWLSSALGLRSGKDGLLNTAKRSGATGDIEVEKYQQWYQGVKVEHGFVNVVSRAGQVAGIQLEFYSLDESFSITPKLSEEEALKKAAAYVGASRYVWQDYSGNDPERKKPSGTLVIIEDYFGGKGQPVLAYKFTIAAEQPLSRSYVYVNAISGNIVLVDRIIKHVSPDYTGRLPLAAANAGRGKTAPGRAGSVNNFAGTAQTRYSGLQTIITDDGNAGEGEPYRLRQVRNGHQVITLNYQRAIASFDNDLTAIDFTDNDNHWTTAENSANYDDAALDVQFAMQFISDYWKSVHNRNSWDDEGSEMRSYVHVRSSESAGYDNAFWDGAAMYYGDGSYYATNGSGTVANTAGFKPLTALDVSAHELGHAVCQSTAQLVYQRESGGINEGFSDIWSACIENYAGLGKKPFLIREEIFPLKGALRNMQNPKQFGDPDTYGGQNWSRVSLAACPAPGNANDQCGVHYNSGVLNKWFYLITQGGSGTNDNQDTYNVAGLGFAKTEKIAFLTEQSLTPNADYAATRAAAINAAATLFGDCSNEVIQVTNAWFAVGVGESANCTPVVEFVKATLSVPEGNGLAGSCSSSTAISVPVKLAGAASQKTDVQFNFGGTAVHGMHFTVSSPVLSFNAGESGTKNLLILLQDNATAEGNKTLVLTYTLNPHGGDATAGINNQTCTITITDDDTLPLPLKEAPVSTVTLLSEDFETATPGTSFPAGWNTTLTYPGGASTTNRWVIGPNAGAGLSGNAAYISSAAATTNDYSYATSSATDRLLRLPRLNTAGLTDIRLGFKYKVGGEVFPLQPSSLNPNYQPALWDFGRVMYDASGGGTSFSNLFNTAANDYFAFYNDGTTALHFTPFRLPASMENKSAVYLAFRWTNDEAEGDGFPLAVDDILVTGRTMGTSIETGASQTHSVKAIAGNANTYLASNGGTSLLAKIANLSQTLPCLTATVTQAGTGRALINTSGGSFFRSEKRIQLKPGTPNPTATYNATFYFTAGELSAWSAAEIPLLKILKVNDGVDLNGTLTASDVQLVTPVFVADPANGYYSYAGDFTGFSQFMLVSPTFPLPVSLLTFAVQPQKKSIALSWTTATETNNKGFEVERSRDGATFAGIGWVSGRGTTTAATAYAFTDNFVQPNTTYQYRLKQVDENNRFVYSSIKQARVAGSEIAVTVSPNPAKNTLNVFVAGAVQPVGISLLNAKGQQVAQWKKINTGFIQSLDVGRFSRGMYTLVLHLPEGDKSTPVLLQ